MPGQAYRLAVAVTHADGSSSRWGGDEPDAGNIPQGISFSTTVPGGFKDASLALARRIDIDSPDLNLYDSVRIYGPGNQTVWEGRVAQLPRQHDQSYSVQVGCVGWAAHLKDDPSFSMIYVDRDLSRWTPMGSSRRMDVANSGTYSDGGDPSIGQFDADSGQPAIVESMAAPPFSRQPVIEAWYDAGPGNVVGAIYYEWTKSSDLDNTDTNYSWIVGMRPSQAFVGGDDTANLRAAGPGTGAYKSSTAGYRYGLVQLAYFATTGLGAAGADNKNRLIGWRKLAVYGDHGLTRHGTDPGGFYASDVIADVLSRAAPLLNYTTGASGSITPTSFAIPQLAFHDPTAADDAISLVNGYHLYEWAVWDDRTFYYQPPDPDRLTWQARLSDGARISLEGDDANNLFNGVLVTYKDPAGSTLTAGPPGSGADTTDASLVDTNASNPINAHGIPRRWAKLDISQTTTQAGAIQLGAIWLAEHSLPQRRGQLTLTGTVTHPTKGARPVYEVRAGDWIKIPDHPTDAARRIVETKYENDTRALTCSLDNTAFKLESIMERLGVGLVGVL